MTSKSVLLNRRSTDSTSKKEFGAGGGAGWQVDPLICVSIQNRYIGIDLEIARLPQKWC